ncbi:MULTISPECIES: heavy-metal-associated domain-containing protein [Haloarcula]|uniref:heavy-metal-associated domain-containing protein n=1 Tax=Haloarcula TaxID=2237 RepID=UPI0023EB520D|nr:heavy metal-associated domain-containing protein [Halomicroarcula sp. XH51]
MATRTLTVTGMACDGCEEAVEGALEDLDGVESATADQNADEVDLETSGDVDEAALAAAIEDAGYELVA